MNGKSHWPVLAGMPNASAAAIKLNDATKQQSYVANTLNGTFNGIHWDIGWSPTPDLKATLDSTISDLYASLQRYTNYKSRFTKDQLGWYMVITNLIDACMAEYARDLGMYRWVDPWATNGYADFWGPGYQNILNDFRNIPGYQLEYNNYAAQISTSYPHFTLPSMSSLCWLLGNAFTDDAYARKNFIFFHCFNNTLSGTTPSITNDVDWLKAALSVLDGTWNSVGFENPLITEGELVVPQIVAALLKTYGQEAFHSYPLMDEDFVVVPQYDSSLTLALNNKVSLLSPYVYYDEVDYEGEEIPVVESTFTESLVVAIQSSDYTNFVKTPFRAMTDENQSKGITAAIRNFLQENADGFVKMPFLYEGPTSGADVIQGTAFNTLTYMAQGTIGNTVTSTLTPMSDNGIVIVRAWYNAASLISLGTYTVQYAQPDILFINTSESQSNYGNGMLGSDFRLPVQSFIPGIWVDSCNTNIYVWTSSGNRSYRNAIADYQIYAFGRDVDEYAYIDWTSLRNMYSGVIRSFVDGGVVRWEQRSGETIAYGSADSRSVGPRNTAKNRNGDRKNARSTRRKQANRARNNGDDDADIT